MSNNIDQEQPDYIPYMRNRKFYDIQREAYGAIITGKSTKKEERRE